MTEPIYIHLALGQDPGQFSEAPPVVEDGPTFGPYTDILWDAGKRVKLYKKGGRFDTLLLVAMPGIGAVYYDKLWWLAMAIQAGEPEFVDVFSKMKASDEGWR